MSGTIAHFIDTDVKGGAETIVFEMCRWLDRHGHDVLVLHFGNRFLAEDCRAFGIREAVVPAHRAYKSIATLPAFQWAFRRFLRENGVALLHSHLIGPITGGAGAAFFAGIPHVGTIHDVYTIEENRVNIRLVQLAAVLGTRLVAVSRLTQERYLRAAWFPASAWRTIHVGVDLDGLAAGAEGSVRKQLGFGDDEIVVVSVGRLVDLKRFELLVDLFGRLRPLGRLRLVLVGEGPARPSIEAAIGQHGLGERVHLLGHRQDVPALLGASDIFALASSTEGLSRAVIEAMAMGLPVVATDVGGNSEVVVDGKTGYLVPAGDPDRIRARLQELIDDHALRRRMGAEAGARVRDAFALERGMARYVELYRGCMGLPAGGATTP